MNLGTTVKIAGGLLPMQLLERLGTGDATLPGGRPADYHEESANGLSQAINRAWAALSGRWPGFKAALEALPEHDRGTSLTRERWLLPLFQELGYGRLPAERSAMQADGRDFAISHRWGAVPLHLVGGRVSLDKRIAGERGAAASAPHGLVQDLLNTSDAHLWAFLSNGKELRILRDHRSLTRQAYVSFDLEAMFDGEQFSAFRMLYLLCHQSRVEAEELRSSWLEKWVTLAQHDGVRALDRLREGVESALAAMGRGFITHRGSDALRERLKSGELSTQEYYRQLLRLVYRLIFLFVAEDRDLLLVPGAPEAAKSRFRSLYATRRLRSLALKRRGGPHGDGWQALRVLMTQLDRGNADLALPALGSFLWRSEKRGDGRVGSAIADLDAAGIANEDLYAALRALCVVQDGAVRRPVDWAGVQADELGSIYEALMERVPRIHLGAGTFELASAAGNERKTTGSYYTPSSLVDCLLDSALDPVLEEAARSAEPEKAILALSVVDPACGSGHFLVAAARRIAHRLARVRSGGIEPSPPDVQHALRDVVGRCIYGVDLNPMAVELCKVSLWMEAIEPGKPLSFLDSHIRRGNALIGATPELMDKGIPDEAWEAIEGDDKEVAKRLKKENRKWKQTDLFVSKPAWDSAALAALAAQVEAADDATVDAVEAKEKAWQTLDDQTAGARGLADLWCAAFVWPKQPGEAEKAAPVRTLWETVKYAPARIPDATRRIAGELAKQYYFFHWHLAFPRVFDRGGFDVVLGNPPWELVAADQGGSGGEEHERTKFLLGCNQYSILQGRRDLYKAFLVQAQGILAIDGKFGLLVPVGAWLESDSVNLRRKLMVQGSLSLLQHFQNGGKSFFPDVDSRYRFCAVVATRRTGLPHAYTTVATSPAGIASIARTSTSAENIIDKLGSDLGAALFQNQEILGIHEHISAYVSRARRVTVGVVAEFHTTSDKALFARHAAFQTLVVTKNRNIHLFNSGFSPPELFVPFAAVRERGVRKSLPEEFTGEASLRLLVRDIARNDDARTLIVALTQGGFVSTYDTPTIVPPPDLSNLRGWQFLTGYLSSYVADFLIRPFVDKHIKPYTLAKVAIPHPDELPSHLVDLVCSQVAALSSVELGEQVRWYDRDATMQAVGDIDAAVALMTGLTRDQFARLLNTFTVQRDEEQRRYGEFRTALCALRRFDDLMEVSGT